ncbi:hypothetical protein HY408_01910 [Candidatus Gottesmanbacteria bacterium]|nr:hypothetical protein [Candidatus Gottesmanbacteria bacterium]
MSEFRRPSITERLPQLPPDLAVGIARAIRTVDRVSVRQTGATIEALRREVPRGGILLAELYSRIDQYLVLTTEYETAKARRQRVGGIVNATKYGLRRLASAGNIKTGEYVNYVSQVDLQIGNKIRYFQYFTPEGVEILLGLDEGSAEMRYFSRLGEASFSILQRVLKKVYP